MSPPSPRPAAPNDGHFAAALARCRSTIVFLGVDERVLVACAPVARELRIARAETKHIQAACSALDAFPGSLVVVSTAIRHSDRHVIEQHAARSKAIVLWVGIDHDAEGLVSTIRSWATPLRPARPRW